ncbi:MAG: hypothetical protein R3C16_13130 [Hyphomonadaceae bacterium]
MARGARVAGGPVTGITRLGRRRQYEHSEDAANFRAFAASGELPVFADLYLDPTPPLT